MKIHIVTGHFFPQMHPRAFRATELAQEFARRGHEVIVTNCWTIKGFDYDKWGRENNILVRNINLFITDIETSRTISRSSNYFNKIIYFLKDYLLAGSVLYRSLLLSRRLLVDLDTDILISSSTPFTSVLGVSRYVKANGKHYLAIADSGDPFYYSKQSSKAIWFKWIEKNAYKYYDYLTIPTSNAVPLYSPLIPSEKIKIIPQGFRMDKISLYKGPFGKPIKFAYAGVFYWDIRNPEFLFSYLSTLPIDFEFHLFMRETDSTVLKMLDRFPSLKGKVFISSLPHDELIYELSKMDFLINIENVSNTQIPSKLIDYGMSGRPIFSCKKATFSPKVFNDFLNGKFNGQYVVDIKQYDIRNIANNFLSLKK